MKPFTYFASNDDKKLVDLEKETVVDTDYNDPSLVGLNFYQQYGQHDDRFGEILEFAWSVLEIQ